MPFRNLYFILLLSLIASCNSGEESDYNTNEEDGIFSRSWSSIKSTSNKPFQYFDERSRKADSVEKVTIAQHYESLRIQYPEYSAAEQWFQSEPPELLGLEGDFYKIIEGTIQNGRSISRSHFVEPVRDNVFLYFFKTEERFFILELEINDEVNCQSVRCIKNGWGEQPMFDYQYDVKGNLVKELFQADVDPSFYEDDGKIYFEFANDNIINTILLGPTINI